MTKRPAVLVLVSVALALIVAFVSDDLGRVASFDARGVLGSLVAGACSAAIAFGVSLGARLRAPEAARLAGVAASTASALAVILIRLPAPWLDLGPFGAGPITALGVVLLPISIASGTAVANAITRGASRTPPSSRRP